MKKIIAILGSVAISSTVFAAGSSANKGEGNFNCDHAQSYLAQVNLVTTRLSIEAKEAESASNIFKNIKGGKDDSGRLNQLEFSGGPIGWVAGAVIIWDSLELVPPVTSLAALASVPLRAIGGSAVMAGSSGMMTWGITRDLITQISINSAKSRLKNDLFQDLHEELKGKISQLHIDIQSKSLTADDYQSQALQEVRSIYGEYENRVKSARAVIAADETEIDSHPIKNFTKWYWGGEGRMIVDANTRLLDGQVSLLKSLVSFNEATSELVKNAIAMACNK